MLLSSSTYFIFLVAIFFLYWPLARFRAVALAVVLFANYFFYAKWDLYYLALIPLASSCDYLFGLGLQSSKNPLVRKILVSSSIVMNLGLLAAFKYMPFFLENWAHVTGHQAPAWHWTLPLSLSFYVFQALTYTIDLYRGDAQGTRSYLAHLAAVSFFPTALAGPITRVSSLVDQFEKRKVLDPADGGRALFLIGMGLMKKLMIADYLAVNLVNRVFDFPNLYTGAETLIAVYAYALEIYYDFSGYTDIALGSAMLLGIQLPANFNRPYAAASIADFWRRWHMSLSNWLRDYLYFSLPGKRSKIAPYINLIVTMVLGGLWHGASWTFVMWGALHGVGLAVVRFVQSAFPAQKGGEPPAVWRFARIILTFHFVAFAWIFFRASSFENAALILSRIASLSVSFANISGPLALILAVAVMAHYLPRRWYDLSLSLYARAPFYAQAAALVLLVTGLQNVLQTGAAPFIYTRF
ncbi:MAG TPA: MBOAT family O-acyltransferase [Bryobacteraceae bacterium]|nr:MBOAT family O-acyltransferase [Bryobacteraceae bacterium]